MTSEQETQQAISTYSKNIKLYEREAFCNEDLGLHNDVLFKIKSIKTFCTQPARKITGWGDRWFSIVEVEV